MMTFVSLSKRCRSCAPAFKSKYGPVLFNNQNATEMNIWVRQKRQKNKHTNKQNKQLYPRGQTLNRLLVADESIAASWCWCSDVLKRVLPVCIRIMWKNHKPQVEHCVQEIHDTASEPLNAVISCTNTDSVSVWYHLKHD